MKEGGATGLSNRDRWLLAILPALAVMVGYVFVIERPRSNEIAQLQAKVEAGTPLAVSGEAMRASREELEQLRVKVAALRASAATAAGKTGPALRRWNSPAERPAALAALSRLLENHTVAAASTTRLVDAMGKTGTDAKLKDWLPTTGATDREIQPEAWQVELVGDYGRIMAVLEALPSLDRVVVPWELSLAPAEDGTSVRRWTLVFLI